MSENFPAFRPDLEFFLSKDGDALILRDPRDGQTVELPGLAGLVARYFDGQHSWRNIQEIARQLADVDLDLDVIQRVARQLHDVDLLSYSHRHHEDRLALSWGLLTPYRGDPSTNRVEVREGLRYECLCCGACCSGRFAVVLNERDVTRLRGFDLASATGVSLDEATERSPDGHLMLRRPEQRCVYLGPNAMCMIHAHFGRDAKPFQCRAFPWAPIWTPKGGVIRMVLESSKQHLSSETGPLVAPQAQRIWDELAHDAVVIPSIPERFLFKPGHKITYDEYLAYEQRWQTIARSAHWQATLQSMRDDLGLPPAPLGALAALVAEASQEFFEHTDMQIFSGICPDGHRDLSIVPAVVETLEGKLTSTALMTRALLQLPPDDVTALLDRYVLDFLFGKYLFLGDSIASGVVLLQLTVELIRHTAAHISAQRGVVFDHNITNEALVFWHTVLFDRDDSRISVLARLSLGC